MSLSDKEFHSIEADKRAYWKKDVREAVKELKKSLLRIHCEECERLILKDVDEIFGEKLV